MEKINYSFDGFTTGQILTSDNLNDLINGLNTIIIPKLNSVIDFVDDFYNQACSELATHQSRINAIANSVSYDGDDISGEISIPEAILAKRIFTMKLRYDDFYKYNQGNWHYFGDNGECDSTILTKPSVKLNVSEYWRIDKNGNYEDSIKSFAYTGVNEVLKNLSLQAQTSSSSDSSYPLVTINSDDTATVTYNTASGNYSGGYPQYDSSKSTKDGYINITRGWQLNHGITALNPNDKTLVDINTTDLDFVYLGCVPTLYDVFSKRNTEYKWRILDEWYGGNYSATTLETYHEADSSVNPYNDWWWTNGNLFELQRITPLAHVNRNPDNIDFKALNKLDDLFRRLTSDIYIADAARLGGTIDWRIGDNPNAITSAVSNINMINNLDDIANLSDEDIRNFDLTSLRTNKEYIAIEPRLDASLAGLFFVIPGSGWGKEQIDWEDFAANPQSYIDQYLGKTTYNGTDAQNNNRDKANDLVRLMYYDYPNTNAYDEIYFRDYIKQHGLEYFYQNKSQIEQSIHKTNYDAVSRMYYYNWGFSPADDGIGTFKDNQLEYWVEGPMGDFESIDRRMTVQLKKGDIIVLLVNQHNPPIYFSARITARSEKIHLNDTRKLTITLMVDGNDVTSYKQPHEILNTENYIVYLSSSGYDPDKRINVPYEDVIADHHHDTQTLLDENPFSEYLYKRYGGRDYVLYAYQITDDNGILLQQLQFHPTSVD